MGHDLCWLISQIIGIYQFILIVSVILSWLIAFNIINTGNQFVSMMVRIAYGATEPALRPIRRVLPSLGGLDLSPIVLLVGLEFLRRIICRLLTGGALI